MPYTLKTKIYVEILNAYWYYHTHSSTTGRIYAYVDRKELIEPSKFYSAEMSELIAADAREIEIDITEAIGRGVLTIDITLTLVHDT